MKLLNILLNILWPEICFDCERIGSQLCSTCGQHITFWENTRTGKENLFLYPGLATVYSATEYIDSIPRLVQLVKFSRYWNYTKIMATLMILQCNTMLLRQKVDVFVPVPIHRKRKSERGFNQTEKLAQALSKRLGIPVNTTSLIRHTYRKKQSLQSGQSRHSLHHDFSLTDTKLQGKVVCLIDDVLTTGATISACARALETTQPKKIIGLTFARTR